MKTIKMLTAFLAIALAIGTSAFKAPQPAKPQTLEDPRWFEFVGNQSTERNDPSKYNDLGTEVTPDEDLCPTNVDHLCAVKVMPASSGSPIRPDATALSGLQTEISGAIGNAPTSSVALKQ